MLQLCYMRCYSLFATGNNDVVMVRVEQKLGETHCAYDARILTLLLLLLEPLLPLPLLMLLFLLLVFVCSLQQSLQTL